MKYLMFGFAAFLVLVIVLADTGNIVGLLNFMHFKYFDKVGHFMLVGIMGFLVNLFFNCQKIQVWRFKVLKGSVWVLIPISLEELSQGLLPGRNLSIYDWLSDVAGLVVFGFLATWIERYRSRKKEHSQAS